MREWRPDSKGAVCADPNQSAPGCDPRLRAAMRRSVQRKARQDTPRRGSSGQAVERATGSVGQKLPDGLQQRFEQSLGADLSGVRVHTGGASAQAADTLDARAYTTGNDIHMAAGEYDPSSQPGQELLAHEVVHTVQQSHGGGATQRKPNEVSSPDDAAEKEADALASGMVAGSGAAKAPVESAGGAVARKHKHHEQDEKKDEQTDGEKDEIIEAQDLQKQGLWLIIDWQKIAGDHLNDYSTSLIQAWTDYFGQTADNPTISPAMLNRDGLRGAARNSAAGIIDAPFPAKEAQEDADSLEESWAATFAKAGTAVGAAHYPEKAAHKMAGHGAGHGATDGGGQGAAKDAAAGAEHEAEEQAAEQAAEHEAGEVGDAAATEEAGEAGAAVGTAVEPGGGTVIGMVVATLVEAAVDRIWSAATSQDEKLQDAIKKAVATASAAGAGEVKDYMDAAIGKIAGDEKSSRATLDQRIEESRAALNGTWDKQQLFQLVGQIQAQLDQEKKVIIPSPQELTSFLLEAWIRDHAKTADTPTADVNGVEWNKAAQGGYRADLFVDQCYKAFAANGMTPPEDLRAEYAAATASLPIPTVPSAEALITGDMVKEKFQDKYFQWQGDDVRFEGVPDDPERVAYCTPVLESGMGGVYVKEWRWQVRYNAAADEKENLAPPTDDQLVDPAPPPPSFCEPGSFDAGKDGEGPSCTARHRYEEWVEGTSEPGSEKVTMEWKRQEDAGLQDPAPDPSQEVSWPGEDATSQ